MKRLHITRAAAYIVIPYLVVQVLMCCPQASVGASGRVSISDLIERMGEYDGKTVVISGEVIGDIMARGDHAWITVNDGSYSERNLEQGAELTGVGDVGIGVWSSRRSVGSIEHVGRFSCKGDTVEVVGIFHRACPEHGGDTDIHASSIRVVRPGATMDHPLSYNRMLAAVLLAGLAVALIGVKFRHRKVLR